jgi:hypothetical protein
MEGRSMNNFQINMHIERKTLVHLIIFLLVFLLFFLYSILYLAQRSFWLDEAMLAMATVKSGFSPFKTLAAHNQSAPWGFISIVKIFGNLFGINDLIFRLPGLVMFSFSLFVFLRFIYKRFGFANSFILCIAILANPILLRYATEYKHYIFEVSLTFLLLTYYLEYKSGNITARFYYAITLFVSIFFGISNIFIAGAIFLVEGFSRIKKPYRNILKSKWFVLHFIFICVFTIWYFASIRVNLKFNVLNYPHIYAVSFQPEKLLNLSYWLRILKILWKSAPITQSVIFLTCLLMAAVQQLLTKKQVGRQIIFIPITIYLLVYLLNILGFYPILKERHLLFILPSLYVLFSYLLNFQKNFPYGNIVQTFFFIALFFSSIYNAFINHNERSYFFQEMKPVLNTIKESDKVVVYFSAQPAYEWYSLTLFPDLPDPINPPVNTISGEKLPIQNVKHNLGDSVSQTGAWPAIALSTRSDSEYYDEYLFHIIKNETHLFVLFAQRDDRNLRSKIAESCEIVTAEKAEGVILFRVDC